MASTNLTRYVSVTSSFCKLNLQNINRRYFNFLFELPKGMSLIGSYLLPSFSLVTLEKIVLIKKVYSEINDKSC